jgi:hypothetical protein
MEDAEEGSMKEKYTSVENATILRKGRSKIGD